MVRHKKTGFWGYPLFVLIFVISFILFFKLIAEKNEIEEIISIGMLSLLCAWFFREVFWSWFSEEGKEEGEELLEKKRLKKLGVYVEYLDEEDIEKVKAHMLHTMQWGHHKGIEVQLEEFNAIFRWHPEWELTKWDAYRAWHKNLIDGILNSPNPEIYNLTMKDGSPYSTDKDPLYDPDAPEWELFDRDRSYDDDDNDDINADYDDCSNKKEKETMGQAAMKGLGFGIGWGIGNSIIGGNGNHGSGIS